MWRKIFHSLLNLPDCFVKEGHAYIHTDTDIFPFNKNNVDYIIHIVL